MLRDWIGRLTRAGLAQAEAENAVAVLAACALDERRLTVVVRMDPAEMDRLLPLRVSVEPSRTVRVGLLVIRNLDPELRVEIEELVRRLGEDDWKQREAAQRRLLEIGPAAKDRVEAVLSDPDPEIATRAEQILDAIIRANKTPGSTDTSGRGERTIRF